MKVIDLLNKIANGEEVPKKIKVYDDIYVYESFNKLYWNDNNRNLLDVYNGNILNYEVEIIEDTSKEDKKIAKIGKLNQVSNNKQHLNNYILRNKINEIIERLNSEDNE